MAYQRKAGNWIQGFLEFTSESEAPDSFFIWTALSTLASVTERKVKVSWAYGDIFPNLYVVLVGPPGRVHKTSVLKFQQQMLIDLAFKYDHPIAMSSQSISREALIDFMSKHTVEVNGEPTSPTTIMSFDLMSLFNTSQEKIIEYLTDLFDCPNIFEHTTRGSGSSIIRNAFINFIAATTPSWIAQYFNISFIEQGFASRTIFIYETKPRFLKAWPVVTPEMWAMRDALMEDLAHIATLQGEFVMTEDAKLWFEDWYENKWPSEKLDYRLAAYLSRKALLMLKVAMLAALAEEDDMVISVRWLEVAKGLLEAAEPKMARAFAAVGKNKNVSDMERIFNDIVLNEGMRKKDILAINRSALQRRDIEDVLANLVGMDAISIERDDGDIFYVPLMQELI